jgi:uncharacterized protein (TIGR02246 family)
MLRFHSFAARWSGVVLICALLAPSVSAAPPVKDINGEGQIRAFRDTYVDAVNRRDPAAIGELWTPDGDIVNETGQTSKGRDFEMKTVTKLPPEFKLSLTSKSLRFVQPDVAIDDGVVEWSPTPPGLSPKARYCAILVKRDGKWLVDAVRETPLTVVTPHEHLAELAWIVGDWTAETESGATIDIACRWSSSGTFITRLITVVHDGERSLVGTQRIGWDPGAERFKSWFFEADGGYTEGFWTRDGEAWSVKSKGIDPEGGQMSAINVYRPEGPDAFTLESKGAKLGGKPLPDFKLKIVRKKPLE